MFFSSATRPMNNNRRAASGSPASRRTRHRSRPSKRSRAIPVGMTSTGVVTP